MCKGHALTRSIFCLRGDGRLLHKKQTIVDLGLLVRNRLPQIFFRDGKHMFVLILVAYLVSTPAGRQTFLTNEKGTITSYKTWSKTKTKS